MGYKSALCTSFQMWLYFQNLGINSTQNCSASHIYRVEVWFSKESATLEIERPVL